MSKVSNSFRVVPVTRYVLEHIYSNETDGSEGPIGEFNHAEDAAKAGKAWAASIPGATFIGPDETFKPPLPGDNK